MNIENSSRIVTRCYVTGCPVDSASDPSAVFFPIVRDHTRRRMWLRMMGLQSSDGWLDDTRICSRHFNDDDIISSPEGAMLRRSADPKHHMLVRAGMRDVGVQRDVHTKPSRGCSVGCMAKGLPFTHFGIQKGISLLHDLQGKTYIKKEFDQVSERLRLLKANGAVQEMYLCNTFLGDQLAEIVKPLVAPESKHTDKYKEFCLSLHQMSPQAYRLLAEDFNLPPIRKLMQINVPRSTEINKEIMDALYLKVRKMGEMHKYCSVLVDIVRLRHNLCYSVEQDKIIGFHEIDGSQSPIPARYAVVVAVRGILRNWSQPVAFALLSAASCRDTRVDVSTWITKIIKELLNLRLYVKTFTCTAKSKLLNEANIRLVAVDRPYLLINDTKIYYIYDFPHMFRLLRNHFLTHDFLFGDGRKRVAKVGDIKEMYEIDKKKEIRILRELEDSHLNPSPKQKRDTKYAAKVLNKTVAAGLDAYISFGVMREDAKDTVEFLVMMHEMYEMLTASVKSPGMFCGSDSQIECLNKILKFFQTVKFKNHITNQEDSSSLLFVKGISVTVKSIILLNMELQRLQSKYLLAGRFTLSFTENFFKKVKTRGNKIAAPTSQQFLHKFRYLFVIYIMKPLTAGQIIRELGNAIAKLNHLYEETQDSNRSDKACLPISTEEPAASSSLQSNRDIHGVNFKIDSKELQVVAKQCATVNSYGFIDIILKKCLEYHNCDAFKRFVTSFQVIHDLEDSQGALPTQEEFILSDELVECIARMEDKFREVFDNCRISFNLATTIFESFKKDPFLTLLNFCPCFSVEFFHKMFIRVRIYMALNFNNGMYRNKDNEAQTFYIPGI